MSQKQMLNIVCKMVVTADDINVLRLVAGDYTEKVCTKIMTETLYFLFIATHFVIDKTYKLIHSAMNNLSTMLYIQEFHCISCGSNILPDCLLNLK